MNQSLSTTKIDRSFFIPAIDIVDGKCVRLSQGDFERIKVYNTNPLEVALGFQDLGCTRLHVVDLDGARSGKIVNWKTLESLSSNTDFVIDFGGGIKSDEDISRVFETGIQMAVVGSVAVSQPERFEFWLQKYSGEQLLLGTDVRGTKVAINGWMDDSDNTVFDLLKRYSSLGLKHYFCTDITKDGMMNGPSFDLYKELILAFPDLNLIASGGVSSAQDILQLNEIGCKGVIVGKALYEGLIAPNDILKMTGYAG